MVFDYVHDDWYYRTDLTQLRGELSWRTKSALELGYRFALATNRSSSDAIIDDHVNPVANTIVRVRGLDQHRLFARYHATSTSVFEFSTGWTGDSDFLLGGQFEVPLDSQFGLATGLR